MSEFRRRLMMQVEKDPNALPVGCVRCEYLESQGASWVDTMVKPSYDYNLSIRYCHTKIEYITSNINPAFGTRLDEVGTGNGLYWAGANAVTDDLYLRFGGTNVKLACPQPLEMIDLNVSRESIIVNGEVTGATTNSGNIDDNIPNISIFGMKTKPTKDLIMYSKMRFYNMIIENGGVKLFEFIPILDNNSVPCIYETVNRTFHYNQGNGQFLYKILEQ